jgi:hypothetical protein
MDIRIAEHTDYKMLTEWWGFWRFPAPSIKALPQYDLGKFNGVIASEGGKDLACGFMYTTNSNMVWIEFMVTNPKTTSEERNEAILSVLNELSFSAKELGYSIAFSSIKNENLINKYIGNGFSIGTRGTTELIKIL